MSPSLAGKHAGHNYMRNASSLSTESSEFEFDPHSFSELNDEPPLSPKLLYSPNYSPNYSPKSALMASTNQLISAGRNIHASKADDHLPYRAPPFVSRINHESGNAGEGEKRMNLRSLLNRRDLEQLPPLTNYNIKSNHQINNNYIMKQVPVKRSSPASTSSSSASPSSSPINYYSNHYTNPCKLENNHPDYAGDASSPPESKSCQKKSRKWTFKLDFLRKGLSPRADQALNQSSNNKKPDYSLNYGIISNHPDHYSIAAAAEEAGFDDYLHERETSALAAAAREGSNYELNHRNDHYRAVAAAGEARVNPQINESIDNSAAAITKSESPRQSTSSVISTPKRAENEMIKANHRKVSKSAPISPAGSPSRSLDTAGEGAFTRGRAPMSPHALHYQQQRARNEELRRKTFLPYRQSLLSACFFPLSPPPAHHHPPQVVY